MGGIPDQRKVFVSAWKNAELITTRDIKAFKQMEKYGAFYLPCPALLSSKTEHEVDDVKKIALVYAMSNTHVGNRVSESTESFLRELYHNLMKKYECDIVCHYIEEAVNARRDYPEANIYYSYNSQDYFDIYKEYDLVVGARVHAMGICASMGIPGVAVIHDSRGATTKGFMCETIDVDKSSVEDALRKTQYVIENIQIKSKELSHKRKTYEKYKSLILEETSLAKGV